MGRYPYREIAEERGKRMRKIFAVVLVVMLLVSSFAFAESEEERLEMPQLTSVLARTRIGDYGQLATGFELTFDGSVQGMGITATNFAVEGNRVHPVLPDVSGGITGVRAFGDTLLVDVDPFLYNQGFRIALVKDGEVHFSFTAADVAEVQCEVVDDFTASTTENGLNYRLFTPESESPLPLVIWFHGGGEGGDDNAKQLTSNRGAVCFAEDAYQAKHPCAVLAPQSAKSWDAEELDEIATVAQSLIDAGIVDGNRVYAVGLAAQQATLRFSARHRDLLAAAMPIIYWKQFDEDWAPLVDLPMWACIAENDFTGEAPNMEEFVESMREKGNDQIRCTIFTDAEMNAYGLFGGLLHWGWIPALNNADMIDWLFAQSK